MNKSYTIFISLTKVLTFAVRSKPVGKVGELLCAITITGITSLLRFENIILNTVRIFLFNCLEKRRIFKYKNQFYNISLNRLTTNSQQLRIYQLHHTALCKKARHEIFFSPSQPIIFAFKLKAIV